MTDATNVLVLCTGNSARSILGEAIINRLGYGRIRGFSAGSFPKGQVHPGALRLLERHGYPTAGVRSKSWDEFAGPDAPTIDAVITVCDNAHEELAIRGDLHWSVPDPIRPNTPAAFEHAYADLNRRITGLAPRLTAA